MRKILVGAASLAALVCAVVVGSGGTAFATDTYTVYGSGTASTYSAARSAAISQARSYCRGAVRLNSENTTHVRSGVRVEVEMECFPDPSAPPHSPPGEF